MKKYAALMIAAALLGACKGEDPQALPRELLPRPQEAFAHLGRELP